MRYATLLLGACSIILGTSTAYLLSREYWRAAGIPAPERCANVSLRPDASAQATNLVDGAAAHPHADAGQPAPTPPPRAAVLDRHGELTARERNLARELAMRREQRELLVDPDYRAARIEIEKQQLWLIYREAIDTLGLPAESASALVELLANHEIQSLERPVGLPRSEDMPIDPSNPPAWLIERRVEQQRRQAEIRGVLGDAKYTEWMNFQQTAAARREVALLGREFELSGDPLRSDQNGALLRAILEDERLRTAATQKAQTAALQRSVGGYTDVKMLEDNVKHVEESNDRLRRAAAQSLSSNQMQLYESVLDRRLKLVKAQLKVTSELLARHTASLTSD